MSDDTWITRRALLAAGAGSLGAVGVAGSVVARAQQVSFDRSQQVSVENTGRDVSLRIDWKEWFGGEVLDQQENATDTRGVLRFPNLLPGPDVNGTVAIGLSVEAEQGNSPPVRVQFRVREPPNSREENGRNEPEKKAGDTTDDTGELQEHIHIQAWYDTGVSVAGAPLYGVCDAEQNTIGPVGDTPYLSGTLAEVSVVGTADDVGMDTWRTLDANASNPADGGVCLGPNESLCLTLVWAFTGAGADVNRVQGDSVHPILEFRAEQCR